MSISIPGRVVVFDYGEVISTPPSRADQELLVATAGFGPDEFWPPYSRYRDDLDQGVLSVVEYWTRIADDLGASWDLATLQRLWAIDFRGWISADAGTMALIEELHAGGTRMALLSNAGFDFGGPFRFSPMASAFEAIFVSAELGLLKPDAEIYRHVAEELEIELAQMVFVDNKAVNVEGATALGVTGHVFTGADELRAFLESLAEVA